VTADNKFVSERGRLPGRAELYREELTSHAFLKYNDLIKSLPGSSWLVLLTLAVVTGRSLPGIKVLKCQSFYLIQIHM